MLRSRLKLIVLIVFIGIGLTPVAAQDERPNLVIGLNNVPDDLCVTCDGTFPRRIIYNVFDPLIGRDFGENGQGTAPIPAIAESWEWVSETELDLTIRYGVLFHNGVELTAEDVAFTLSEEKLWGEAALTPDALAIGVFENVEVMDERTVRVTTAFPDPALISRLQSHIGRVIPRDYFLEVGVDAFNQAPIGTGPYRVVSYEARDEVRLAAFDEYWGGTPPVATITYRDIPELSTRVAGLLAGELDLIVGVIPQQIAQLEAEGFRVEVVPQENIQMFAFMSGPEELPIHDARIRRALIHAADLETIAEQLFGGTVQPLVNIQSAAYGDYFEPLPSVYDPELARQLVEESDYEGEGIRLQFIANNFVLVNETALLLQEMWADVGLRVQLDIIPDFTLHTLNPPTEVSMWSTSNNISMPDPFNPVCTIFTSDGQYANNGRITVNPELDALCQQLEQAVDFDARLQIWRQIQAVWAADPQALFLWQRPEYYALRADLDWQPLSNFSIAFGPEFFPAGQ
jgi:peptide/nickel transport system substrate-binding protein